jgi:flagellar hook-associated protein 1 FlgK
VLLDGQTPLVIDSKAYNLSVQTRPAQGGLPYAGGDAGIMLVDQTGADVTSQATGGKLGALLLTRNQTVPYYIGSQTQQGELNNLAKSFASRVNTILTNAQTAANRTVIRLFTYDLTNDTKVASSLSITDITPDQIVTADGTGSNGVAIELANITNPTNAADLMADGQNFAAFYGQIAGKAGADAAQATTDLEVQRDLTAQAQNQRAQVSGVSLNDQAAQLMSLQQAYQATARIVSILASLGQTTVNLIPQA